MFSSRYYISVFSLGFIIKANGVVWPQTKTFETISRNKPVLLVKLVSGTCYHIKHLTNKGTEKKPEDL